MEVDLYTDGSAYSFTSKGLSIPKELWVGSYAFLVHGTPSEYPQSREVTPDLRGETFQTNSLPVRSAAHLIFSGDFSCDLVSHFDVLNGNGDYFCGAGQNIGLSTNQLEVLAVAKGLQVIPDSSSVRLHSDSEYVQNLLGKELYGHLAGLLRREGCYSAWLRKSQNVSFHKAGRGGLEYWQFRLCHEIANEIATNRRSRNSRNKILSDSNRFFRKWDSATSMAPPQTPRGTVHSR